MDTKFIHFFQTKEFQNPIDLNKWLASMPDTGIVDIMITTTWCPDGFESKTYLVVYKVTEEVPV